MINIELLRNLRELYQMEKENYLINNIIDELNKKYNMMSYHPLNQNISYEYPAPIPEPSKIPVTISLIWFIIGSMFFGQSVTDYSGGFEPSMIVVYMFILLPLIFFGVYYFFCKRWTKNKNTKLFKEAEYRHNSIRNQIIETNKIRKENAERYCPQVYKQIAYYRSMQEERKRALDYLYSETNIHTNYRNLYSISKIYELIDTGICDKLTGVDGAYSQMKIDEIIDNQKISISLQEKAIRQNAMMYAAIQETNNALQDLRKDMVQNMESIESYQQEIGKINDNLNKTNYLLAEGNRTISDLKEDTSYLAYCENKKRIAEGHFY